MKDDSIPDAKQSRKKELSIIIVTYQRKNALNTLLKSLLKQDFKGIKNEIIIINNSPTELLSKSLFTNTGRLLRQFKDAVIINSSRNWGPGIRYTVATMSKYKNILFLDDDIYPTDKNFIKSMLNSYLSLRSIDILTCWAELWTKWSGKKLSYVSVDFFNSSLNEIIQVDYCGTGICMYNKKILFNEKMLFYANKYPFADTAWFPWIPSILFGTKKYYFPAFKKLAFHEERKKNAICLRKGYDKYILKMRKQMLRLGYKPVLEDKQNKAKVNFDTLKSLPVITKEW